MIIVLLTIAIEALLMWGVSYWMDWSYIDVSSLGGLLIFMVAWLIKFNSYHVTNAANAYARVWAITEDEKLPFSFKMSPLRIGMLVYAVASFGIAFIVYLPYFLD